MYNVVDCPNNNAKMYNVKLLIFSGGNNLYLAANSANTGVSRNFMSFLKFNSFIYILTLFSCGDKVTESKHSDNDTLKILRVALHQGISDEFMPSASPLKRKYRYEDSILLTSDILPLNILLSSIENQKFKVLPRQQICSTIVADSNMAELPNYLSVTRLEKSDTGYYIQVRSLSCMPYGGGGSLGLYFKKVGDTLKIVDQSASSIN